MGGIAALAKAAGHHVTGADAGVYPPMSTQLQGLGIDLTEGWDPAQLDPQPDVVVIGNALSRGNAAVEAVLERGIPYTSGPQWLAEQVLADRWVLAVAGTHGKTTTATMLAWILEQAGLSPGFLIGGVPIDFDTSARLGAAPFFVVEADEYDTAFFDKRSKFVHYRPRTAILNNLEFDHADIFPDLAAIERQFHHLVRTIPGNGCIISNATAPALERVLGMGCWTPVERIGSPAGWEAFDVAADFSTFKVAFAGEVLGEVCWQHSGTHMVENALAAIAAARHAGVPPSVSMSALSSFGGVRRRMESRGTVGGVTIWDDFAHHPTAIATTLSGLRSRHKDARIIAVVDPRSNTMRLGHHAEQLPAALSTADIVVLHAPEGVVWDVQSVLQTLTGEAWAAKSADDIVTRLLPLLKVGDQVLIMSNGGFGGIHQKLLNALEKTT